MILRVLLVALTIVCWADSLPVSTLTLPSQGTTLTNETTTVEIEKSRQSEHNKSNHRSSTSKGQPPTITKSVIFQDSSREENQTVPANNTTTGAEQTSLTRIGQTAPDAPSENTSFMDNSTSYQTDNATDLLNTTHYQSKHHYDYKNKTAHDYYDNYYEEEYPNYSNQGSNSDSGDRSQGAPNYAPTNEEYYDTYGNPFPRPTSPPQQLHRYDESLQESKESYEEQPQSYSDSEDRSQGAPNSAPTNEEFYDTYGNPFLRPTTPPQQVHRYDESPESKESYEEQSQLYSDTDDRSQGAPNSAPTNEEFYDTYGNPFPRPTSPPQQLHRYDESLQESKESYEEQSQSYSDTEDRSQGAPNSAPTNEEFYDTYGNPFPRPTSPPQQLHRYDESLQESKESYEEQPQSYSDTEDRSQEAPNSAPTNDEFYDKYGIPFPRPTSPPQQLNSLQESEEHYEVQPRVRAPQPRIQIPQNTARNVKVIRDKTPDPSGVETTVRVPIAIAGSDRPNAPFVNAQHTEQESGQNDNARSNNNQDNPNSDYRGSVESGDRSSADRSKTTVPLVNIQHPNRQSPKTDVKFNNNENHQTLRSPNRSFESDLSASIENEEEGSNADSFKTNVPLPVQYPEKESDENDSVRLNNYEYNPRQPSAGRPTGLRSSSGNEDDRSNAEGFETNVSFVNVQDSESETDQTDNVKSNINDNHLTSDLKGSTENAHGTPNSGSIETNIPFANVEDSENESGETNNVRADTDEFHPALPNSIRSDQTGSTGSGDDRLSAVSSKTNVPLVNSRDPGRKFNETEVRLNKNGNHPSLPSPTRSAESDFRNLPNHPSPNGSGESETANARRFKTDIPLVNVKIPEKESDKTDSFTLNTNDNHLNLPSPHRPVKSDLKGSSENGNESSNADSFETNVPFANVQDPQKEFDRKENVKPDANNNHTSLPNPSHPVLTDLRGSPENEDETPKGGSFETNVPIGHIQGSEKESDEIVDRRPNNNEYPSSLTSQKRPAVGDSRESVENEDETSNTGTFQTNVPFVNVPNNENESTENDNMRLNNTKYHSSLPSLRSSADIDLSGSAKDGDKTSRAGSFEINVPFGDIQGPQKDSDKTDNVRLNSNNNHPSVPSSNRSVESGSRELSQNNGETSSADSFEVIVPIASVQDSEKEFDRNENVKSDDNDYHPSLPNRSRPVETDFKGSSEDETSNGGSFETTVPFGHIQSSENKPDKKENMRSNMNKEHEENKDKTSNIVSFETNVRFDPGQNGKRESEETDHAAAKSNTNENHRSLPSPIRSVENDFRKSPQIRDNTFSSGSFKTNVPITNIQVTEKGTVESHVTSNGDESLSLTSSNLRGSTEKLNEKANKDGLESLFQSNNKDLEQLSDESTRIVDTSQRKYMPTKNNIRKQNFVDHPKTIDLPPDTSQLNSDLSFQQEHANFENNTNIVPETSPEPTSQFKETSIIDKHREKDNEKSDLHVFNETIDGSSPERAAAVDMNNTITLRGDEIKDINFKIDTGSTDKKSQHKTLPLTNINESDQALDNTNSGSNVKEGSGFVPQEGTRHSFSAKGEKRAYHLMDHRKEGQTVIRDLLPVDLNDNTQTNLQAENNIPVDVSMMTDVQHIDFVPEHTQHITSPNDGSTISEKQMFPYTQSLEGQIPHTAQQYWADRFNRGFQVFSGTNIFLNLGGPNSVPLHYGGNNREASRTAGWGDKDIRNEQGAKREPFSVNTVINLLGSEINRDYNTKHKPTALETLLGSGILHNNEMKAYGDRDVNVILSNPSHEVRQYSSTIPDNGKHPLVAENQPQNHYTQLENKSIPSDITNHSENIVLYDQHVNEYEKIPYSYDKDQSEIKKITDLYPIETAKVSPTARLNPNVPETKQGTLLGSGILHNNEMKAYGDRDVKVILSNPSHEVRQYSSTIPDNGKHPLVAENQRQNHYTQLENKSLPSDITNHSENIVLYDQHVNEYEKMPYSYDKDQSKIKKITELYPIETAKVSPTARLNPNVPQTKQGTATNGLGPIVFY